MKSTDEGSSIMYADKEHKTINCTNGAVIET